MADTTAAMTPAKPAEDYTGTGTAPTGVFHTFFPITEDYSADESPSPVATKIYEESTSTAHVIGGHYVVDDESSSSSIILIAVILATVLVFLCIALVLRYMLKHKGSYHTNENKEANWDDSEAAELRNGDSLEDDLEEDV